MKFNHSLAGCALIAGLSLAEGAKERMFVVAGADEIKFNIDRFDDGRSRPYRIVFFHAGNRSLFRFNAAGKVTSIKVNSELYKISYETKGNLDSVERASSNRRFLTEDEEDEEDGVAQDNHRKLYDCADCEEAWDAVCDEGVPTVCDLVDYGSPFSGVASTSVEIICQTFSKACSALGASEACAGQCGGGEEGINSCLDPTSDDYKCDYTGSDVLFLFKCNLVDTDVPSLLACFENFGMSNIDRLDISSNQLTTVPEGLLDGLTELTALDMGVNPIAVLPSGAFSGLSSMDYLYLVNTDLTALPEDIFASNTKLETIILFENKLTGLPKGLFEGLTKLATLSLDSNQLTTLPAGLLEDNTNFFAISFERNFDLQCVPANTAEYVELTSDDILQGTCGCTPAIAVICDEGYVCVPGDEGYTCET